MQISIKILFIILLIVSPFIKANETLNICNAGGYFSGAQDRFMSGLAAHILVKQGLLGATNCSALWKQAYDVGASYSRTGKVTNNTDAEIVKSASDFAEKVYSSIAKNIGF